MSEPTNQERLVEAAFKFSRGEITVEELTALASKYSAATHYVENNVIGPYGILVEEFQGMDIEGYLISLYHNPANNISTVVTRWPGSKVEYNEVSGHGVGEGYSLFEDEKASYRARLRRIQLEKYGENNED